MIQFTAAVWPDILAQSTAAGRANALAGLGIDTIEFLDAAAAVIRTVTTGAWTVSGANAVPGAYTDAGTGGGTPSVAVFKAGATEIMRMTCGTWAGADYRLLANIGAGVPIRRGPFAVLFLPPPEPGTSQPSVVTAPTISGVAKVGQVITATPGVYAGNPVPTVTRQWYSGATAISGAAGLTITVTDDELGGIITFVEVPSNSVGSITVPSNALGPVVAADLNADAVPNPVNIDLSSSFDFAPYIVGGVPPYRVAVGAGYSLPSGASLPGTGTVLTVDGTVATGLTADFVFDIDDSAVAATLPKFGVLSSVGGADLPFAFGHVFKQGDVPSGSYVDSDLTDWQCVPTTTWPDGSLRHAIISGLATCTQNVRKDITLSVSGTDRTGTALTETDLAAALTTATIQGGSHETALASLIGTAALHRTVCTGPIMSNWIYRHAVTSSNHLVIWIDVRLYKGGRVEIFPWIENAYLTVANPTNDVRTWTVTIGGTQVFSQSIDIKHHTRIPLISGSSFSYWTTDPGIVPVHDTAYMMASKMVPNYGWTSPSSATLDALQQSYTPNTLAGISTGMGLASTSAAILNQAQALYCTSGDVRAYRAAIVFGLSGGSWSIHYRAEATSTQGVAGWPNEPARFASYPSISTNIDGSPAIPNGTGDTNGEAVTTHQPSYGYLPWLLTGRWWFLEESLFWAIYNYVKASPLQRRGWRSGQDTGTYPTYSASGDAGIIDPNNGTYSVRGAAWGLRTLAQTLAILPDDHPCLGSLKHAWEQSVGYLNANRVTETWVNGLRSEYSALGIIGDYTDTIGNSSIWGNPGWMSQMIAHVLGWCRELDLPQTTGAELESLAAHALKLPVVLSGDGSAGTYHYRRFTTYALPIAAESGGVRGAMYTTGQQAFDALETAYSLAALDGDTTLKKHSENGDLVGDSNDSSWPYFGQAYAALSYAVDKGVTGATEGRSRILAASNYPTVAQNFNNDPVYGIVPRSA